jgi:2-polyprenyl-3-methyl-5-hydroxy-6-metoxy-1,4-benzoquinol methylase
VSLIGFGADARKLYFQFSFIERSDHDSEYYIERVRSNSDQETHHISIIKLDEENIADNLVNKCWEPAAEAALLTIGSLCGSGNDLKRALFSRKSQWIKRSMRDEWDYRSSKSGLLPVMSVRYPQNLLSSMSKDYINTVMSFIGENANGKSILEVGSGIGRVTEALAEKAQSVTCVELCGRMISLSLSRLGALENVNYVQTFGQDYRHVGNFDLIIASLVLIHNSDEGEYERLIENLCTLGNEIYIFEDTSKKRFTSPSTRIRSKGELCNTFEKYGFSKTNEDLFILGEDKIAFLKFEKSV